MTTRKFKAGDKVKLSKEYLAAPYASKELTGVYTISSVLWSGSQGSVMALVDTAPGIRSPRLMHEYWLEPASAE